jgi:hypothetical protein
MRLWGENGVKLGLHRFDGQWAKGQNPKASPHEDTVKEAGAQLIGIASDIGRRSGRRAGLATFNCTPFTWSLRLYAETSPLLSSRCVRLRLPVES